MRVFQRYLEPKNNWVNILTRVSDSNPTQLVITCMRRRHLYSELIKPLFLGVTLTKHIMGK